MGSALGRLLLAYLGGIFAMLSLRRFTAQENVWRFKAGPLDRDRVVGVIIIQLVLGVIAGGKLGLAIY